MHRRLGLGKYSVVFEGFDVLRKKEVILKVLKHSNFEKINREILTLQVIASKSPFLAQLVDFGIEEVDGAVVLVGPWLSAWRRAPLFGGSPAWGSSFLT